MLVDARLQRGRGGTEIIAGIPATDRAKRKKRRTWNGSPRRLVNGRPAIGTPFSKTKPDLTLIYRWVLLPRYCVLLLQTTLPPGWTAPAKINPLSGERKRNSSAGTESRKHHSATLYSVRETTTLLPDSLSARVLYSFLVVTKRLTSVRRNRVYTLYTQCCPPL